MAVPRQILVALVEDKPGVLNRVAGLFRRRGFNIASLAVGHSETPNMSRMTIVVEGDEGVRQQAARQLRKLIGVMEVRDITDDPIVARELTLIKVKAAPQNRSDIISIVEIFRGDIVDVEPDSMVIQATGDENKIEALHNMLRPFGVMEIMRTGQVAMVRGSAESTDNLSQLRPKFKDIGGV